MFGVLVVVAGYSFIGSDTIFNYLSNGLVSEEQTKKI
jgi:hypothetical protein